MHPKPIEQATIDDLKAWLSDQEADTLAENGQEDRIPRWPMTPATLVTALRIAGIENPEQLVISVDATLTHLHTHTKVFKEWTLIIGEYTGTWVQVSPSVNADVYVWGAESDSFPVALAVLALCVACYPEPEDGFDDRYYFRAPLTPNPES